MGIAVSQVQRHTSLESSYIPVELRRDVLKLGHYVCAFCYKKEKHDLCHDIPKARGGVTEIKNLLICCRRCQKAKDVKTAAEFKERLAWEGRTENIQAESIRQSIRLEIYFLDGEVLKGTTNSLPGNKTQSIWVTPEGNGQAIFVNIAGSVKKIVFKSVKMKDLNSLTSGFVLSQS
ncbi:hypothetical protein ES703_31470 [subsurface metagenome]